MSKKIENEDIEVDDIVYAVSIQRVKRYEVKRTTSTTITITNHDDSEIVLNRNLTRRGEKSRLPMWTYYRQTSDWDEIYQKQELLHRLEQNVIRRLSLDKLCRIVAIVEEVKG